MYLLDLLIYSLLFAHHSIAHSHSHDQAHPGSTTVTPSISQTSREHWVRRANQALSEIVSPCPLQAFGTAIVNHTDLSDGPHGKLICLGVNDVRNGNPVLHGETAAIENCTSVFRRSKQEGGYGMNGEEAGMAWRDLSLYTNGEPCPMCSTAIRWAGFKECIYSVSAETLTAFGWPQIKLRTQEIFERSDGVLGTHTELIGEVLEEESSKWFSWQYTDHACPHGCARTGKKDWCEPVREEKTEL